MDCQIFRKNMCVIKFQKLNKVWNLKKKRKIISNSAHLHIKCKSGANNGKSHSLKSLESGANVLRF